MIFNKNRNTKNRGVLHFRIFRWDGRFIGVCKETGFVEEGSGFDEVKNKLINGSTTLLRAVIKSKQNLEPSLNTSPPLKYAIYFHLAPLLSFVESFKDSSLKENGFLSFNQPVSSLRVNG